MKERKSTGTASFLQGAAMLSAATIIVKIIGAIYKIPLLGVIGEDGYGYFNTAYDIYSVLLMISTTGLPVAMSRMISEAQALNQPSQIQKIFSVSLKVFLCIGIVGSLGMLLFCRQLSVLQTTFDTSWAAIAVLAPSVFFICIISAFRGFFQGQSNMAPTSISQVFEALCKLFIGMACALLVMKVTGDPTLGAGGAILGVTVGCVVSALYLWRCYRKASRDLPSGGAVKSTRATVRQLLLIAVPITLGAAGLQIINMVDTMVYMRRLTGVLHFTQEYTEDIKGVYNFCQTIFNLPCAIITTITISIIPAITRHLALNNAPEARRAETSAMRLTGLIAMPCAFGLMSLAEPIMILLGRSGQYLDLYGTIMLYLGATVIFNSIVLVSNAMMQAHGDVTTPVINLIIGGVVKVIANFFLVANPDLHIAGAAIGTLICYAVITGLNGIAIVRRRIFDPGCLKTLFKPLLAGLLMGAVTYMAYGFLASALGSAKLACLAAMAVAVVVYAILVYALRIITYDDCMLLPGGEKLAKILHAEKK